MRVVQVSAHYPPNHVSGGTLVPQRLARGMAARGHDVFVYAGHLDADREPLETWTEDDGQGVTVRWIVTTPWTAWADPRNSVNPEVEADFAAWLREVRPDVVHLHSLQTLGAGLVTAARASGARVLVTMHDFWWTCARQFLVAPDMHPCSLVVSCGSCPCAGGHAWLERRNRTLRAALADADLVLTPSLSAARVMVANGVDERRVRVDENGLPDGGAAPAAPAVRSGVAEVSQRPLRMMFAGGPDPMKGLDVLREAVGSVPDGAWSLDLYGVDQGSVPPRPGVRCHPAYGRQEVAAVMAEHDVLLLPSVMRESHSIVTREALGAGLAVVCTDTLGPEEVVSHGVNGLVVPAGDPALLADALTRLIDEPDLVGRLRAAPLVAPIRDLADQVAGLEEIYQELLDGPDAALEVSERAGEEVMARESLMRRVLVVVGIAGAALRYRGHLPAEALRLHGLQVDVRHYRDPSNLELADAADAVVLYRVPATIQVVELVARVRARQRPVPVLFDIDDLIFDPSLRGDVHGLSVLSSQEEDLWWRGVARYRTTMELCDAYVGSTEALCEHATATTGMPAFRYPNGVGTDLARLSELALEAPRTPGPLRLGYFSGTNTHDADWAVVEPALLDVLERRPDVELWLGGLLTTGPALEAHGDRVRRLPMLPWTELPARLRQVDVNLAPLVLDNRFNEAKSAIKWLEAALVETPTVASPTQPFREAIEDGRTGRLASTHEEWVEGILALLDDPLGRRRTGVLARREALLRWGPHVQGARYLALLDAAAGHRREHGPRATGDWEPVLEDEPWDAAAGWLEPHPGLRSPLVPQAWSEVTESRLGQKLRAAVRVTRAGGPVALVRKLAEVGARR